MSTSSDTPWEDYTALLCIFGATMALSSSALSSSALSSSALSSSRWLCGASAAEAV